MEVRHVYKLVRRQQIGMLIQLFMAACQLTSQGACFTTCFACMLSRMRREFWWPSFPVLVYFKVRSAAA